MTSLLVATLNLRNIADRWAERLPLLLADFAALQPDVIGLQEVVYPLGQDRLLAAGGASRYEIRRSWAGRPEYGNAILVRERLADRLGPELVTHRTDLGWNRSVHCVDFAFGDGDGDDTLRLVNTHLHHLRADTGMREEQAGRLLDWLAGLPETSATVALGDFNAEPEEPAIARIEGAGFRSAFREATGADPDHTFPSGIVAPMTDPGRPICIDYIWLAGAVRATSARVVFDRPSASDPTLYPSDHIGLAAEVAIG
jgi:endonuclease/exonuclease/phosphatase family metal-dependent hydrolase